MKRIFINLSDEDYYHDEGNDDENNEENNMDNPDESNDESNDDEDNHSSENSTEFIDSNTNKKEKSKSVYLIHNEQIDSDDPNISEFLKFCINKGLFDNTFYDMHNAFSVVATKLPQTFEKLSSGKEELHKKSFIKTFKTEYGYSGDISFIYDCLDTEKKGFITWDEFVDFFLPFVQYITV